MAGHQEHRQRLPSRYGVCAEDVGEILQVVLQNHPVRFTPLELEGGKRTYELEAELTLGKILSLAAQTCNVPDGI